MQYGLISQAQIDELPEDHGAAFVQFERICRQSLGEILEPLGRDDDWDGPRLRYIATVAAAAEEYGIAGWEDLTAPDPYNFQYGHFVAFEHEVSQMVTRLQIKGAKQRNAASVKLPASRSADIVKWIEVLRRRIEAASEFDEKKKAALYKKLEALKAELTGKRADLSKTMLIVASIMTAVNQAEAAVIKLPEAIAAVIKVIGYVKEDEEAEKAERAAIEAAAKPKAIEDKRPKPPQSKAPTGGGFSSKLDDEIPF